jgi:hypothetical protein
VPGEDARPSRIPHGAVRCGARACARHRSTQRACGHLNWGRRASPRGPRGPRFGCSAGTRVPYCPTRYVRLKEGNPLRRKPTASPHGQLERQNPAPGSPPRRRSSTLLNMRVFLIALTLLLGLLQLAAPGEAACEFGADRGSVLGQTCNGDECVRSVAHIRPPAAERQPY